MGIPDIRGRDKSKFGSMFQATAIAVEEKLDFQVATAVLLELPLEFVLDETGAVEGVNSGINPTLSSESVGV